MSRASDVRGSVRICYVGGPTAIIEIGGVRLLIDPTFDPPGTYPVGSRKLTKTAGPAFGVADVGPIDAVLLSHDQHPDNLDHLGRDFLRSAPLILSTASARDHLDVPVQAIPCWESIDLPRPDGGTVRITTVPAQHGPDGSEHLVGEVIGWILSGEHLPTVYVSGDNASLDVVRTIAQRIGSVDITVLFAGAAQTALVGDAYLTLTSDATAEATRILGTPEVVPLHFEQWAHFTQNGDTLRASFKEAGLLARLHLPKLGEWITL